MTIARTLGCAALTVEAVASASWHVLLAAVAAYWIGDVCDAILARSTARETRFGAALDVVCDRACCALVLLGAVALESSFALPVAVYLLAFVVVDTLLSLTFLAWPLLGVNYLRLVDERVWLVNFSPPAKLLNSAVFLLLLLAGQPYAAAAAAMGALVLKSVSLLRMVRTLLAMPSRCFRGFGSGAAMSELLLVAGVFALAFVSAFVPLVSIELALVMAAATGTSGGLLVGQVLVAAAGQMIGKSCFFLGGRTAFTRWTKREKPRRSRGGHRLGWLVARAARQRVTVAVTVFVSAVTGLPPFAVVSALGGAWRLRLSSFFVLGLAGRSARFAGVLLVQQGLLW